MIGLQALSPPATFSGSEGAWRLCNLGGVSPSLSIDRTCIAGALSIWAMSTIYALRGMTSVKSQSHRWSHGPRVERSSTGTCSKVRHASLRCFQSMIDWRGGR